MLCVGLIDFLVSKHRIAQELREKLIFKVMMMMMMMMMMRRRRMKRGREGGGGGGVRALGEVITTVGANQ